MNDTQKRKTKFRASKRWKDYRHKIFVKQNGLDFVTQKKLRKFANLHHICLDPNKYEDLSNDDNFVYVNHNTHSWIHEIYTYYKKDPTCLNRLKEVLDRMVQVNARN